ncbi:hypothetical protein ACFSAV_04910 [Pasteurella oralis]|uniref:Transmembrane protein n=1 Tax=Pasteurella oralis TaxID=1071947 RepID=A0ABW4NT84_9PAST
MKYPYEKVILGFPVIAVIVILIYLNMLGAGSNLGTTDFIFQIIPALCTGVICCWRKYTQRDKTIIILLYFIFMYISLAYLFSIEEVFFSAWFFVLGIMHGIPAIIIILVSAYFILPKPEQEQQNSE